MIANNLGVRWGNLLTGAALTDINQAMLLGGCALSAVVDIVRGGRLRTRLSGRLLLLLLLLLLPGRLDVDVSNATVLSVGKLRHALVLDGVGELGDNVPRVQQAGDEAQTAQEDVDERVGAADATLNPDGQRGE